MTSPSDADSLPALSASVQILPLPAGLYLFSVKTAVDPSDQPAGELRVPAMHVGLGPGVRDDQVEFVSGPSTAGAWLFAKEDVLVTKVSKAGATLVLTSVRGAGGQALKIKVERLDVRSNEPVDQPVAEPVAPDKAAAIPSSQMISVAPLDTLPLQVTAHVRTRGDMVFNSGQWAGRIGPGLWIESFSVRPLDAFSAKDIEYKALTGSGFETPWISNEAMCGTKGMSVPLIGFAVRLKQPSANAAAYDCEYSGYFKSGITMGPLRNGAPCRSTVANDPLEGIQMRLLLREASNITSPDPDEPKRTAQRGPSFGRYRDAPVAASTAAPVLPKNGLPSDGRKSNGGTNVTRRVPSRSE